MKFLRYPFVLSAVLIFLSLVLLPSVSEAGLSKVILSVKGMVCDA